MSQTTIPAPPPPEPEPGTLSYRLVRLEADSAELRKLRERARAIFALQLDHLEAWEAQERRADECVRLVAELAEGKP